MKKVMLIFGTRPEAIKMCPLVKELQGRTGFQVTVCVTGQHREMLDQILQVFQVVPDYDLAIMREGQTLFDITAAVLTRVRAVLEEVEPDLVLVHGDTSTAFAAALACFYLQIPVGHVEAGLRTYDLSSPFPEEFNRQAVDLLSRWHFAPTETASQNLLREGRPPPASTPCAPPSEPITPTRSWTGRQTAGSFSSLPTGGKIWACPCGMCSGRFGGCWKHIPTSRPFFRYIPIPPSGVRHGRFWAAMTTFISLSRWMRWIFIIFSATVIWC